MIVATRHGVALLALVLGFVEASGCSWIFVEPVSDPKSLEDCGTLAQAKKDELGSGIMALASTGLGLASIISFSSMHSDTGDGIIYGANFAVAAGVLTLPALLWGLSSFHGYSSYWTCVEKVESISLDVVDSVPVLNPDPPVLERRCWKSSVAKSEPDP